MIGKNYRKFMFLWQMIMGVKCYTVEWLDIARLSPNSKLIKTN